MSKKRENRGYIAEKDEFYVDKKAKMPDKKKMTKNKDLDNDINNKNVPTEQANVNKREKKSKKDRGALFWVLMTASVAVVILLGCQFIFVDNFSDTNTFMKNTKINGIDVSGLTEKQAENLVSYNLLNTRDEVSLKLTYKDQTWEFSGSDFEIANDIDKRISEAMNYGREGNFFERRKILKQIKKDGLSLNISYKNVLGGIDQKIDELAGEIEQESEGAQVVFNPDNDQPFSVTPPKAEIKVDREKLLGEIDTQLKYSKTAEIQIPVTEIVTEVNEEEILSRLGMRSKFSTNYAKSSNNRKINIKKALSKFNGMIVKPGEEVSFNQTTGPRTEEYGYKKANIILNGVYVEGAGGGVCQASTTLYNALLLSGIDVLEVTHHSLPASYVPLSLDAMVAEGSSDLKFVNNMDFPIYIKTYGTDEEAVVEVYGCKFEDGESLRTRAELIKILPHSGDKIVPDTLGEYSNYIVYKGEYYRVKYPKEGYESKAYLQILKNGEVMEEREIRHDYYWPQEGIIAEGTEEVTEGIVLPENKVKFIPPQKVNQNVNTNIRSKLEKENPSAYNP